MNTVTIELPEHAVRLLKRMCKVWRQRLQYEEYVDQASPSLAALAEYDSLNAIESAIP